MRGLACWQAQSAEGACKDPPGDLACSAACLPACPGPAERKPLYLECSSPEARRLYLRHGFKSVRCALSTLRGGQPCTPCTCMAHQALCPAPPHTRRDIDVYFVGGEGGVPCFLMARPPVAKTAAHATAAAATEP